VAVFKEDIADGTTFTSCGVSLSFLDLPGSCRFSFWQPTLGVSSATRLIEKLASPRRIAAREEAI